jgi:hypothetical protein
MATTTNYGWTTPDDTDLVKDGAAAIRTLGSSIDTSLVNLLGGTTGQVLTKSSGTDLDFAFATPAAGGMTLLSTTTLSGASTTISSISGAYTNLELHITGIDLSATGEPTVDFNSTQQVSWARIQTTAAGWQMGGSAGSIILSGGGGNNALAGSNTNNALVMKINNYAATGVRKGYMVYGGYINGDGALMSYSTFGQTVFTAAIDAIKFFGVTYNGGTVKVYGVK